MIDIMNKDIKFNSFKFDSCLNRLDIKILVSKNSNFTIIDC